MNLKQIWDKKINCNFVELSKNRMYNSGEMEDIFLHILGKRHGDTFGSASNYYL